MALDMFITFKTPNIKGESVDKAMKDSVDILAWSWGASNSGSTHVSAGSGAGKANFQDLSFTKYQDSASAPLMIALAKGTHLTEVILTMRKAGDGQKPFYVITLGDVLVSSISLGGSGGEDRLTENVTLNFGNINITYSSQSATGAVTPGTPFKWDIQANAETK
jgi:type VI secretion system secreted protein Hcp